MAYRNIAHSEELADFGFAVFDLVDALQRETTSTARILPGDSADIPGALAAERGVTDAALQSYLASQHLGEVPLSDDAYQRIAAVEATLTTLGGLRERIDRGEIDGSVALESYEQMVVALVDLFGFLSLQPQFADIHGDAQLVQLMLEVKSSANHEAIAGVRALGATRFNPRNFQDFFRAVERQNMYFQDLLNLAPAQIRAELESYAASEVLMRVDDLRRRAFDNPALGAASASGEEFYQAQMARIDILREIENGLIEKLHEDTEVLLAARKRELNIMVGAAALFSVLALVLTSVVSIGYRTYLNKTANVAEQLANGNLDVEMPVDHRNEVGSVLRALMVFRDTTARTRALENEVRDRQRDEEARRLRNLQRTTRQAELVSTELRKTALSIDHLTESVQTAASHAADARVRAEGVRQRANQGSASVSATVAAMENIQDSTNQIGSITQIINGIAFQTNLLALNARVEAARAGVAGRGFAVVASEVQQLAGRSAKAAAEIEHLIARSAEQVEQGVRIAVRSNEELGQIERGIEDISKTMVTIAETAREQSAAISEINTTTSELDASMREVLADTEEQLAAIARTERLAAE